MVGLVLVCTNPMSTIECDTNHNYNAMLCDKDGVVFKDTGTQFIFDLCEGPDWQCSKCNSSEWCNINPNVTYCFNQSSPYLEFMGEEDCYCRDGNTSQTVDVVDSEPFVHPERVPLGLAGNFAILTKAGISTVPQSIITGDIGVSPIASTAMTGFSLYADATSTQFTRSAQVDGRCYSPNYAVPTPAMMTTAVLDMQAAYTDASSRVFTKATHLKNYLNVGAGLIGGNTFTEGVYQWGSDVNFAVDIYIKGNKYSQYIFQSTGNVIAGSGARVVLVAEKRGGSVPNPDNIVWVMAGYLDAGTTSHFEGIFLVKTKAVFKTGSSLNGRILAQTACTLGMATITVPTPTRRSPPRKTCYANIPMGSVYSYECTVCSVGHWCDGLNQYPCLGGKICTIGCSSIDQCKCPNGYTIARYTNMTNITR
jgi:hypothetical protein